MNHFYMHTSGKRQAAIAMLCGMLATATPVFAATDAVPGGATVANIIKAVDRYRTGQNALQVETRVSVIGESGSVDKSREYTVFLQPEHKTLVVMRSAAEKGQKVLMLGDDFWLMLPGSQRPMRITPAQKLLGDASTGDIATMRWADDYTATEATEEQCKDLPCLKLTLTAARKSVSYSRIDLWVGKTHFEPLRADLYVQSGKLAKQAQFVMDSPKSPESVAEMVLVDQLSNAKETRIKYVSRVPKVVPADWLNPMFLATNPTLD